MSTRASAALAEMVLEVLRRDADLEDIATTSEQYIADRLGYSRPAVGLAIQDLRDSGRVTLIGQVGKGPVNVLRIEG